MQEYYYSDETRTARGPHTISEIGDLLNDRVIKPTSLIWRVGDPAWQELRTLPDYLELNEKTSKCDHEKNVISQVLHKEQVVADETPQIVLGNQTAEDKAVIKEEDEAEEAKKVSRHQLIRTIRRDLDALWECQREAIIASIKDVDLDEAYQATRKQNKTIYNEIESAAIDYWRTSGVLRKWIGAITWQDADYTRRLRGRNEFDRYADLQEWLQERRVAELSGCYCFKAAKKYIYVGRATVLRDRLKQYEKSKYLLLDELAVRVLIPKNKTQIGKMERMLILLHQPDENRNTGDIGNNPVDRCLEFIKDEIKELLTDF